MNMLLRMYSKPALVMGSRLLLTKVTGTRRVPRFASQAKRAVLHFGLDLTAGALRQGARSRISRKA